MKGFALFIAAFAWLFYVISVFAKNERIKSEAYEAAMFGMVAAIFAWLST